MPDQAALAQLRDIHLPNPVGWWPLAPGWYGLGLVLLFAIGALIYLLWRNWSKKRSKREALRLLAQCEERYELDADRQRACACVSELLKRAALHYFPRQQVAGLQGASWLTFLNKTSKNLDFNQVYSELLQFPYHPSHDDEKTDLSLFFMMAGQWIKQRRKHV